MEPNEPAPDLPLEDAAEPATEESASDAPPETEVQTAEAESDSLTAEAGSTADELGELASQAQKRRLSPAEEERATALLKERLVSGKSGVASAAEILPKLAWMVGVAAVAEVWKEMKATAKTQLLKALADDGSDGARRVRLSLARALFKLDDAATGMKIALAVVKEMRGKETGEVSPRDAQIFSNVFLGKAKPWCAQLPLAELRPGDADALVHCAIVAAFATPHPPVTQLGVLKWAAENGRLAKLHEHASPLVIRSIGRWGPKWQAALRNEVADLPEELLAALPAGPQTSGHEELSGAEESTQGTEGNGGDQIDAEDLEVSEDAMPADGEGGAPSLPRRERPVYVSKTIPSRDSAEGQEGKGRESRREPRAAPQQGGAVRGPAPRNAQFNVSDALRQIEAHVSWLRGELKNAESKMRPRDDEPRRGRRRPENVVIEGEPSLEELARLNVQLESRIATLQAQIGDLTADSEDRAASRGALVDAPAPSPDEQLRTLLALKLQDDYADFLALEQEARDLVVQQHYRALLREVFDVLKKEGVRLHAPAEANVAL